MKAILTIGIFCFFSLIVQAQVEKDSLYLHPKNFILDEMVFSANRWEQNLREVAGRVTKIDKELVQLQNPQTAADLLSTSNQVFIQKSQQGGGSPMIRGFSTNRVLLVIDGVRMNNAIFRSGNVQNVISLDANAIENAEVIFGPGSVIYGSDAIGGVMDFHTLTPTLSQAKKSTLGVNALARYASANNEKTIHADVNVGFTKWAFLTSVTLADYDDLKMGKYGLDDYLRPDYIVRENNQDVVRQNADARVQVPGGYSQQNIMQKIMFQLSAAWDVTYGFHFSKTSSYARYDRLVLRDNANNLVSAEWNYGPQKWAMHTLSVTNKTATALSDHLRFVVAYQQYEESRHNRNVGNPRRINRLESVNAFSANLDGDKKLSDHSSLFYGAELITNAVGSTAFREHIETGEISGVSTRYPDGSVWRNYAAYVSLKQRLNKQWLLTMSTRLTHIYTQADFDKTYYNFPFDDALLTNTALTGSAGIIYTPSTTWKLYGNVSTGFRAPNVDDIGKVFDSQPGFVVVPNPALTSERAYTFEVGGVGKLSRSLVVDFGAYYTVINNAIVRAPSTFNEQAVIDFDGVPSDVLALQNVGEVTVYGVQSKIDWDITDELTFTSTLNWQKGNERQPGTNELFAPTHVAPLFGGSHLVYRKPKFTANLYALYNGEIAFRNLALTERADAHLYAKDKAGNPYSPAWWTLNAKSSFKILNQLTIDAGIENILNKRYRQYASGISAPGINFIAAIRLTL